MPVRMMQAEEFRQFFSTMLTDEGFRGELARDGLAAVERRVGPLDLPEDLRTAIVSRMPALQGRRALGDLAPLAPACGACGICGTCALCAEIDVGAGVAAVSAAAAIA